MAQNLILVTVYGENKTAISTPYSKYINPLWIKEINSQTNSISGANSAIQYFLSGPAGGSFVTLQVSQTQAELVAAANGASPALTNRTAVAINVTGTMSSGDLAKGYITSTSPAAVGITTRTFAQIVTELGASAGSTYDWVVDNISGANVVTITPGANITASSALTGGNDMTLSAGEIGVFRITFGAAAAIISRLA